MQIMKIFKNIKIYKFSIFFIFVVIIFCTSLCVQAQTPSQSFSVPRVYIEDLKIGNIQNNQITGTFSVRNNESYYLSGLGYQVSLIQDPNIIKDVGTVKARIQQVIDSTAPDEALIIPPEEAIVRSFIYKYPENINSGNYILRVRAITDRGLGLGWQDVAITLKGNDKFLEIDYRTPKIIYNDRDFALLEGVNISPADSVTASFDIKNPGDAVTAVPNIKIYNRQINMPVYKEYQDSPITFSRGETKTIQLEMPKIETPESYLAEIIFYDGNNRVSASQYFRWVVKGPGGKILYIKTDKDYFKAGESIGLTIETVGPAETITQDNLSDIGKGSLEVSIYDKDKNLIASDSRDVMIDSSIVQTVFSIPVKNDLISPGINVKLIKDGKVLDESSINLPIYSLEAKAMETAQKAKKDGIINYLIYAITAGVAMILFIAGFLLYKFKLKKR